MVSLQTFTKSTFLLSLSIPVLVLGIPLFDALLAIWRRSIRLWLDRRDSPGAGKRGGIMQADLEHIHHRLLAAGLSTARVTSVLYALNLALVACGLLATTFKSRAAGLFLIVVLGGVYLIMRHVAFVEMRDTGRALLGGLRRPSYSALRSITYQVWDIGVLASALAVVMPLVEPARSDFWHAWFLDLPVWVTPTFCFLAWSRTYLTVWSRCRGLDVLMLVAYLLCGLVLSLGIALLIDPSLAGEWCLRAIFMGALSHPLILLVRLYYRCVEELAIYFRNSSEAKSASSRLLLYGAGGRCQLFLKERGFNVQERVDKSIIVGLVDDDVTLHGHWVYGYQIRGGGAELAETIARLRITDIIITAQLGPDLLAAAQTVALEKGVRLSEWGLQSRSVTSASSAPARVLAPEELDKAPDSRAIRLQ